MKKVMWDKVQVFPNAFVQWEFYHKEFPYYRLRKKASRQLAQAVASMLPIGLIWWIPCKKRVKIPVGVAAAYGIWKHLERQLPLRIQASYERYVEKLQEKPKYDLICFPDMEIEQIEGEGSATTVIKAKAADIELMEFTGDAIDLKQGYPRYDRFFDTIIAKRCIKETESEDDNDSKNKH